MLNFVKKIDFIWISCSWASLKSILSHESGSYSFRSKTVPEPSNYWETTMFVFCHLSLVKYKQVLMTSDLYWPVCPFIECDDLPTLLVCRRLGRSRTRRTLGPLPGSVEERDTIQPCNLTSANIRTLEVRVEHHVEVERAVLAGVVHADVQVQLLLPQDDPVGDLEVMLPHAVGEVTIAKGKYCLNITTGHPFGALFQLPFANSCKPMVGWTIHPIVPLTKLWKYKRNSTTNGLSAIKNWFLTDK